MVLLAQAGFISDVVAIVAAVGGFIAAVVGLMRYLDERRKRKEAEAEVTELIDRLKQPISSEGDDMEQKLGELVDQLVNAVRHLRGEVADLKQRISKIEEDSGDKGNGGSNKDDFQEQLRKLQAVMTRRGINPGKKEIAIWDNGFERLVVAILNKGNANHRVLFPEPRHVGGKELEDDTVPVAQLRPFNKRTA